jgi:hypothetical protein
VNFVIGVRCNSTWWLCAYLGASPVQGRQARRTGISLVYCIFAVCICRGRTKASRVHSRLPTKDRPWRITSRLASDTSHKDPGERKWRYPKSCICTFIVTVISNSPSTLLPQSLYSTINVHHSEHHTDSAPSALFFSSSSFFALASLPLTPRLL